MSSFRHLSSPCFSNSVFLASPACRSIQDFFLELFCCWFCCRKCCWLGYQVVEGVTEVWFIFIPSALHILSESTRTKSKCRAGCFYSGMKLEDRWRWEMLYPIFFFLSCRKKERRFLKWGQGWRIVRRIPIAVTKCLRLVGLIVVLGAWTERFAFDYCTEISFVKSSFPP